MRIHAATVAVFTSCLALGLCQDATANDVPPQAYLDCVQEQVEELHTYVMHEDWCYYIELSCEDLEIGNFGMFWQPFYGSWGIQYAFVGTGETGGCGAIVNWQAAANEWELKCEFERNQSAKAKFKSVKMDRCLDWFMAD